MVYGLAVRFAPSRYDAIAGSAKVPVSEMAAARRFASGKMPLALAYYKNVTGKDAPANQAFGDALIADIDSFQATVSTRQAIQLAREFRAKLS